MSFTRVFHAVASSVALGSTANAAPATGIVRNVVLVHGAFADGSYRKPVADILQKDDYGVAIVQEPTTSIATTSPQPTVLSTGRRA